MLEKWCSYSSHGEVIPNTRIIAFKVPLRKESMQNRDAKEWFTLDDLVKAIPNLGLVIDLCNTQKYYKPKDLESRGIIHKKVVCVGGAVPPKSVTDKFCSIIDDFLKENDSDKLVGVHCTHGLNRTGYLVCRYLMTRLNMTPNDAIKAFEEARGHQIERPEFIEYLKKFEDPEFVDNDIRSNKFVPNRGWSGRPAPPHDDNRGPPIDRHHFRDDRYNPRDDRYNPRDDRYNPRDRGFYPRDDRYNPYHRESRHGPCSGFGSPLDREESYPNRRYNDFPGRWGREPRHPGAFDDVSDPQEGRPAHWDRSSRPQFNSRRGRRDTDPSMHPRR